MPTQKEIEALKKVFLASRDILLDKIINSGGAGTKTYYNTVLKQLEKEIERLQQTTGVFVNSAIPKEYKQGLDEVYSYFKRNNLMMRQPDLFANIHTDSVYNLAREMQYQISEGIAQAGRQVLRYLDDSRDNALRRAGLEATAEKILSGSTVTNMRNRLIEKLQTQGFMTVQYGSGPNAYQVSLDSYAGMVARSTTREAGNIARENQLTSNGYDLVEMTTHYPTCNVCAQFQGRVYSISGKDKRFPPLSRAFASGYHNVHPNCRHSVVPWIEELQESEEVQQAINHSNAPFEDNRDQKQIDLYNKQQAQNCQIRQDLYQYERYKAALGGDAPKSLSAFKLIKNENDSRWGILQAQYKGMGYYHKAILKEPEITKAVVDVAQKAKMSTAGLEYRIKSKESFLRKIKGDYDPEKANTYEVNDILRYTYTAGHDELAEKTLNSIALHNEKGYNTVKVKNTWDNPYSAYKGINTIIKSPTGQKFELQYHTPESFDLKNGPLHKLYEEWRLLDESSGEAIELSKKMFNLSKGLKRPKNIEKVK